MNIIVRNIPNTLTCLNILCGALAIVASFSPDASVWGMSGWQAAALAIGCAALFDFLDGFMARLLGAYSMLGKELDSLSDLVSFGVAPAMLLLNMITAFGGAQPGFEPWSLCALAIPVLGALRLARFNIDTRQTSEFIGMPIPANAIFWIGYAASAAAGADWLLLPGVAIPVIFAEALLMVAPWRMFSLKFKNYAWSGNGRRWILIIAAIGLICAFGLAGLLYIILLYLLLSLIPSHH